MISYEGRKAVVTGGVHGIGEAISRRLADLGASVVVLDLDTAARSDLRVVGVDLADPAAVVEAARTAVDLLGGVDVLVNCAGMFAPQSLVDLDDAVYQRTLAVNLHAPVVLMRELGRRMAAAGYGRVVNISSVHARLSEPMSLAYDVAKAGLEAATRTAALELAPDGVLVNGVAPGFIATRMSIVDGKDELESEAFRTQYIETRRIPLARAAAPDEVAVAVAWLGSALNTYVTGQVVTVDGGLSSRF